MAFEFHLPDIGEGVVEGEIVSWKVKVGDVVKLDQPIVEVMTDKATVTIVSPTAGVVVALGAELGKLAAVGSSLAILEVGDPLPELVEPQAHSGGSDRAVTESPDIAAAPALVQIGSGLPSVETASGDARESHAASLVCEDQPETVQPGKLENLFAMDRPLAAPATRKLARELGVDLLTVKPSGPQGRITQDDVKRAASSVVEASAPTAVFAPAAIRPPQPNQGRASSDPSSEERVALRGVRKRIFEQMARSKHTAAHFTFVEECDATALKALREKLRSESDKHAVPFNYLPIIIKACVSALRKHPTLNSTYDETSGEIVLRKFYNIGVAVSTDAGLMVPVVKRADQLSLLEVASEVHRLANDARAGKAKLDDLHGSTFTITSLGALGGLFATPVLNFPEVAILGVHQIKQKPVVRDGQIVIGDVMLLSLSFDHRIVDGHVGAAFAYEVIRYLENPDLLMLEMV